MLWQDLVFLVGSLLTVVALLPTLRNATTRIPLETSLPKMGLAAVYAATFYSLEMTISAAAILATGVAWCLIALYRSPSVRSTSLRSRATGSELSAVSDRPRGPERRGKGL